PNPNFNGTDNFCIEVCDNGSPVLCDTAHYTVIVTPVNDPPVAVDDYATTPEDTPVTIAILSNDSDIDGSLDPATIDLDPSTPGIQTSYTVPGQGTFVVNPVTDIVTFTPVLNFNGVVTPIPYQVCDNGTPLPSQCAQAVIHVTVTPVNDPPVAVVDYFTTPEDTPVAGNVTGNDSDVDGNINPNGYAMVTGPAHGTISFSNNGTFIYTPAPNYNGTDSFIYSICDLGMPVYCDTAIVYITITPVNDPPVIFNEQVYICMDGSIEGNVLTNGDYDPDGTALTVSTSLVYGPSHGTFSVTSGGGFYYTPAAGFTGLDTVVTQVCDNGIPQPPACTNDTVFINVVAAVTADAGPNQQLCQQYNTFLTGNWPPAGSVGNWIFVSGPNVVTPAPANSPMATVVGLIPSPTPYVFRYTITSTFPGNTNCFSEDTMSVINYHFPSLPYAGPDQNLCLSNGSSTSTAMVANIPLYGTGTWVQQSGPNTATIADIHDPGTTVSNLIPGDYAFLWEIGNGVCEPNQDEVFIHVYTPSIANAGPDATICEGSTYVLSGSTASNFTSLVWATTGTGSFSDYTLLHPVYTPSAGDIAAGNVRLYLTAFSHAPCAASVDTMKLTINRQAIANAGPDATICETTTFTISGSAAQYYQTIAWTTTGTGSFSNAAILHPVYTASAADIAAGTVKLILTLTSASPCVNAKDTMILTISRQPLASAGPNATICETSTYTLSGSSAQYYTTLNWTTSGTGTFSNPATLHPIYTPSAADITAGTVTLTLTANANAPCNTATSSMTLSITKAPLANAGPNASICQGSTFTVSGATASNYSTILWTAPGPGTLTNAATLTPTYTPTAGQTGTVVLTLTANPNTGCTIPAVSTMTLTITAAATANAGPNATICEGSVYTLSGATATNYSSIFWTTSGTGTFNNNMTLNPVYTPGLADITAGTVVLTLHVNANTPCNNLTSSMTLTINRQAIANAGPDGTICETSTFTISGSAAQYYQTIAWTSTGTGSFSSAAILHPVYTPSAADISAGTVKLIITLTSAAPCVIARDTMVLNISRQPLASAGPNATICETSTYTLSGSSAQYYTTLNWTTSGTGTFSNPAALHPIYTPSAADIAAGTVTLTLTANAAAPCNTATSSMTLSITKAPLANAGPNASICQGSAYTVNGATASNYASILWTAPGPGTLTNAATLTPTYTPTAGQTGTVVLTLTANPNTGCTIPAVSTMTLTITAAATASAGPNATICEGSVYTL
ncbi:MAG: Ig-like domain-containing protein, partial [Bacteroidetes bacterium]|nr:Ig-like domain-containing protein [Bacteroidota bacterium]